MSSNQKSMPEKRRTNYAAMSVMIFTAMFWMMVGTACSSLTPTSFGRSAPRSSPEANPGASAAATAGTVKVIPDDIMWRGFCATAKAIPWMATMDARIVLAIKEHNHLGAVHCGWPE